MSPDGVSFVFESFFVGFRGPIMQRITFSALLSLELQLFQFLEIYPFFKWLQLRAEKSWEAKFSQASFPDPYEDSHRKVAPSDDIFINVSKNWEALSQQREKLWARGRARWKGLDKQISKI